MQLSRVSICATLMGAALVCLASSAAARSITSNRFEERDPMMALPSDRQPQLQYERPVQEVRYVTYQSQPQVEYQAAGPQQPPQHQEVLVEYQPGAGEQRAQHQQVVYAQQPAAPYQLIQAAAQGAQPQPQPQAQRVQYVQVQEPRQQTAVQIDLSGNPVSGNESSSGEYPGEIVYVGQNGETSDGRDNSLASVANSLHQNAGLTATILTEVPVKDMPYEVLDKLKREYGVKVVATRERPGANLLINCDEHSASAESSICAKQPAHYQPSLQSIGPVEPQHAHHHQHHHHQPPVPVAYEYPAVEKRQQAASTEHHQPESRVRAQVIHVEHVLAPASHEQNSYAPSGHSQEARGQHEPHMRLFSHRGVVEEVVEQPTYQPTNGGPEQGASVELQTTPAVEGNNEHTGDQQHQPNEYYGARTATTVAVNEQPSEGGENQATAVEQPVLHEQAPSANAETTEAHNPEPQVDQNSGFDEQPKANEQVGEHAYASEGH